MSTRAILPTLLVCLCAGAPALAQDALFTIEGDQAGERLGAGRGFTAVSDVDGDGVRDVVVAEANYDGPNGVDCGRVQLLSGKTRAVLFTWDGENAGDWFGRTIDDVGDIDGDGIDDLAIAASQYPGGARQGKVYVYSLATKSLIWSWTGEKAGDDFQYLRGVGDATGDGVNDVMVTAFSFSVSATDTYDGKVYLYSGADGSLVRSWVGTAGQFLGYRISRLGFDVDGDGAADFAVGSFEQSSPSPNPGHVYVLSAFHAAPIVTLSGANDGDCQGYVDDAGDVDGDGIPDLLVGSPYANGSQGVQYVYSGKDWSVLRTWNGTSSVPIGAGSSMAGDVDGDGFGDVLVGFTAYDGPAGVDTGILQLRSGATGRVLTTWFGEQAGEAFSFPSRSAGDLDGDGIPDQMTIGNHFTGAAGADCGKVYAFRGAKLYLDVTPAVAVAGDTVAFTTTAGVPGNPGIDVVTSLDGVPAFTIVGGVFTFDGNGELALSGTVPSGLGGHVLELESLAIGRSGKVVVTSTRTLTLQ